MLYRYLVLVWGIVFEYMLWDNIGWGEGVGFGVGLVESCVLGLGLWVVEIVGRGGRFVGLDRGGEVVGVEYRVGVRLWWFFCDFCWVVFRIVG